MSRDSRSSERLPLKLPVQVQWSGGSGIGEQAKGSIRDISGNGVFLSLPVRILPKTPIRFIVLLPRGSAGTPVELLAQGRVVRQSRPGEDPGVAAIIDDYRLTPAGPRASTGLGRHEQRS